MTVSTPDSSSVEWDAEGFLLDSAQWTVTLAEQTARENGIDRLTDRHWHVINSMRTAYLEHGALPWVHMIARVSEVGIPELFDLFPTDPSRAVTKVAGIPKNRACI